MKAIFRIIGFLIASCSLVVVITLTFAIAKKVWFQKSTHKNGYIAVVDLKGVISDSKTFVRQMKESLDDVEAKAVIVRINSPGGMVGPSQEMYEIIRKVDEKKPVYVSMSAVAASGGFYAAVAGRKIYANPGTLTASVGVIAEFANTEKLFKWAKVDRFTLKAGKLKDVGSPLRSMEPHEKEFLQGMLNDIHGEFQNIVKIRRQLSDEVVQKYLDGRVMTGKQAFEAKLVDMLGSFELAASDLKKSVGLPLDAAEVSFEEDQGILKKILWGDNNEESRLNEFFSYTKTFLAYFSEPGIKLLFLAPVSSY